MDPDFVIFIEINLSLTEQTIPRLSTPRYLPPQA
jgi:hypothetical protein